MKLQFCMRVACPEDRYIDPHTHPALEIVYFVTGVGTSAVAGRIYNVQAHAFTIIPAGIAHDQRGALTSICIGVADSLLARYQGCWHDSEGTIGEACRRFYGELQERRPAYDTICKGMLWEIAGLIERQIHTEQTPCEPSPLVDQALRLIAQHDGQLSVGQLADQLYVSTDYLRHLFQENALPSPIQHIIEARIAHAKTLLVSTRASVRDVAAACGFESAYYFSRLFKKTTGLSPTEFRVATEKDN